VNDAAISLNTTLPPVNTKPVDFMGKSWKEKPWKYKNDRNFQKKQKKHQKGQKPFEPSIAPDDEPGEPVEAPWPIEVVHDNFNDAPDSP